MHEGTGVCARLSPECCRPFEVAFVRPPTLVRPPMLRALLTPGRDVRAVLAFVATVCAKATCTNGTNAQQQARSQDSSASANMLVKPILPAQY